MAIPPPPPGPPGPPPPPIGNLKLGAPAFGKSSGSGGDTRSALLLSIQQGKKLKKTTTNDKSGPLVAGRIADTANSNARSNSGAPSRPPPPSNGMNGSLRGPFEGMSVMPKLKPVGGRAIGVTSPTKEPPSSTSTGGSSPQNTSNGTAVDFSTELSQRIAMKNQMKPQQKSNNDMNTRNRGPPPQPPSKSVTDNNSSPTTANSSPLIKQSNSASPTSVSSNGANISILPNKSSLFGSSNNVNTTTIAVKTTTTTNKVVPNYGKPTCAPKPPVTAKNGLSPLTTTNNGNSNRSIVSRAQSMRAPRSPPISVAGSTFPQQFGTIRGIPAGFQDAMNSVSMRPAPTISRPTVAPPRPPIEAKSAAVKEQVSRTGPSENRSQGRCKSPPPPPKRSVSNTNLPALPLSVASSALSPNLNSISKEKAINFGGSATNVSTLMNNIVSTTTTTANTGSVNNLSVAKDRSPNTSSNSIAPPPPPHRAPPPPIRQTSIAPISNNSGAPPVPLRHSSMRNSNGAQQATVVSHQTIVTSVTPNSARTVTRFVMDLEAKFGQNFHRVTEFPPPQPFTKFEKCYPSQNIKATTEIRKAKAPSPPSAKVTNSATPTTNEKFYLQLAQDDKLFTDESSYC